MELALAEALELARVAEGEDEDGQAPRRDQYDLDQDVKLFFSIACVAFDAFAACWEEKYFCDSSRPYWYVRWFYKGKTVKGYAGPCAGFKTIPAEEWHPYSPDTFVTPPFPGYI